MKCGIIFSDRVTESYSVVAQVGKKIEQERKIKRGHKETFGDDRYVHYLGCGDGFMVQRDVKICQIL